MGRYNKLFPAAAIYAIYFVLLQFSRDLVAEGNLSAVIGLWWVHLLFIGVGLGAYRYPGLARYFAARKSLPGQGT